MMPCAIRQCHLVETLGMTIQAARPADIVEMPLLQPGPLVGPSVRHIREWQRTLLSVAADPLDGFSSMKECARSIGDSCDGHDCVVRPAAKPSPACL